MSAPLVLQTSSLAEGTSPLAITLTGVTAGSTIVVYFIHYNSGSRVFATEDDQNGLYTPIEYYENNSRQYGMFAFESSAGGTLNISIYTSNGAPVDPCVASAIELSACSLHSSARHETASNNNTHYCAPVGELNAPSDAIIVSGSGFNTSAGTVTGSPGFTTVSIDSANCDWIFQYKQSDSGFTAERSQFTSTTSRQDRGFSAVYVASGGGGGGPTHTITIDAGSFEITGVDAGFLRSRSLAVDAGSLSLDGGSVSFSCSRVLPADAGSLAIIAGDATFAYSRTIAAETGSFDIIGSPVSFAGSSSMTADAGAFTIDTFATGLLASRRLIAALEPFTTVQSNAGLVVSRRLIAETGSLASSGTEADLIYSGSLGPTHTIECEPSSLVISGVDTSLVASRVLPVTTAPLLLAATQASLVASRRLPISTASLAITGNDSALTWHRIIAASTGAFLLNGNPITLTYSEESQTNSLIIQYYQFLLGA